MMKFAFIFLLVSQAGCVTRKMVAQSVAAGFFAGRIESREDIGKFIESGIETDEGTIAEWEKSNLNIKLVAENRQDYKRVQLLTGHTYNDWIREYKRHEEKDR